MIAEKVVQLDGDWLKEQKIIWSDKGDYFILNYDQFSPPTPYNTFTRSLVVNKLGKIASFPFVRFFNFQETKNAAKISLENSDVIEKLDGAFIALFWDNGELVWHSRRSISSHQDDRNRIIQSFASKQEYKLLEEASKYISQLNFCEQNKECTLVFELIIPMTKVITEYNSSNYGLYLIGCRDLTTRKEKSEEELDILAKRIGSPRPRRWSAKESYDEIIKIGNSFPPDYEGFVVRDRTTGERVKVKLEDYLERHKLLTEFSQVNLISHWCKGNRDEIQAYFPHSKDYFNEIENKIETLINKSSELVQYWLETKIERRDLSAHFDKAGLTPWQRQLVYWHLNIEPSAISSKIRDLVVEYGKGKPHMVDKIMKEFRI